MCIWCQSEYLAFIVMLLNFPRGIWDILAFLFIRSIVLLLVKSFLYLIADIFIEGLPWWLKWYRICLQHRRPGLIPGSERSPGGRHGNPLQHPCLDNPMDRGAWRAAVHGVIVLDMTEWRTLSYIHWKKSYILLWNWWALLFTTYSPNTH